MANIELSEPEISAVFRGHKDKIFTNILSIFKMERAILGRDITTDVQGIEYPVLMSVSSATLKRQIDGWSFLSVIMFKHNDEVMKLSICDPNGNAVLKWISGLTDDNGTVKYFNAERFIAYKLKFLSGNP